MKYELAFKRLKEKFENVDSSKLEDMAIQFTLSDADCGGTFYAEIKNGTLAVEPYDYKDNNAVVDVTRASLIKILDGKMTIDKAIENGDLTVKGDLSKISSVVTAIKVPAKAEVNAASVKKEVKAEVKAAPVKKEVKTEVKAAPVKAEVKTEVKAAPVKAEAKAEAAPAKKAPAKKAPAARKTAAKKITK